MKLMLFIREGLLPSLNLYFLSHSRLEQTELFNLISDPTSKFYSLAKYYKLTRFKSA